MDCIINEFFVKPDEVSDTMLNELVDQFCDYYRFHTSKEIIFFADKYGSHQRPNIKQSKPYNEQVVDRFIKNKWRVTCYLHKGMESPQHEKYLLWSNIMQGYNPRYPHVIINGKNCKFTLISMNNTKVVDKEGKFQKDKSSERKSSIMVEEATHFGDAVDKRIWTKYGSLLLKSSTFVNPRI